MTDAIIETLSDSDLINQMEMVGAQCWREKGKWTVFISRDRQYSIQTTRGALREALQAAFDEYYERS
jgi:hypothetical protein